jgi:hypothetical protein
MTTLLHIEEQLKRIGCNFKWWGRAEIRELANILMDDEIIAGCVNGRYAGGFALLCVTNHRLLLVDRKPMFLTLEDIRFDMIAEIDYNSRLLDNTLYVITPNRSLTFTSWNEHRLRKILSYIQQRVMEVRQHYVLQQFQPMQTPYQTPTLGGLAVQGGNPQQNVTMAPYPNAYTKMPLIMRTRRRPGKF